MLIHAAKYLCPTLQFSPSLWRNKSAWGTYVIESWAESWLFNQARTCNCATAVGTGPQWALPGAGSRNECKLVRAWVYDRILAPKLDRALQEVSSYRTSWSVMLYVMSPVDHASSWVTYVIESRAWARTCANCMVGLGVRKNFMLTLPPEV